MPILESPAGSLNKKDWKQWLNNARLFSLPYLALFAFTFLLSVQQTGFSKAAFYAAAGAAGKALVDALVDLLRKYLAGAK
jgi:hypothetical protein